MIIRFSIENHLSIREEQQISFVASALKDRDVSCVEIPNTDLTLLPAAVLYGANASGKSNFISGCQLISQLVRHSHESGDPEGGVPRTPFLLDKKCRTTPTRCVVEFVLNDIRHEYGFSCDDKRFLEEWLYTYPSGKRQTLFLREPDKKHIYFGKNLRGSTKTIETLMRPNSLYLSVAAQNAHEQLTPIFRYFANFSFKFGVQNRSSDARGAFLDGEFDTRIIKLLKRADTGISNVKFEDDNLDLGSSSFAQELTALMKKHSPDINLDFKTKKISLGHATSEGDPIFFDLSSESSGTIRLLILFKEIFAALDSGSFLAIDEIDASLHTYLVEDIFRLFNSKTANPKGAQLLATTHDTNLLCGELLRRDQIWFVEKDKTGSSTTYPLTDIRTRNTDNIEKGYLEGRFGAVPFRGRLDLLVGDE
jgi:AAA15 family ATPase/GTPase